MSHCLFKLYASSCWLWWGPLERPYFTCLVPACSCSRLPMYPAIQSPWRRFSHSGWPRSFLLRISFSTDMKPAITTRVISRTDFSVWFWESVIWFYKLSLKVTQVWIRKSKPSSLFCRITRSESCWEWALYRYCARFFLRPLTMGLIPHFVKLGAC